MRIYIDARCNKKTLMQPISCFVFSFQNGYEAHVDADEIDWRFDDDNSFHARFKGLYYCENDEYCGDELMDASVEFMFLYGEVEDDFEIKDADIYIWDNEGNATKHLVLPVKVPT